MKYVLQQNSPENVEHLERLKSELLSMSKQLIKLLESSRAEKAEIFEKKEKSLKKSFESSLESFKVQLNDKENIIEKLQKRQNSDQEKLNMLERELMKIKENLKQKVSSYHRLSKAYAAAIAEENNETEPSLTPEELEVSTKTPLTPINDGEIDASQSKATSLLLIVKILLIMLQLKN